MAFFVWLRIGLSGWASDGFQATKSKLEISLMGRVAWRSSGVPVGAEVQVRGFRNIPAPAPADPVRGKTIYAAKCASCHGASGEGIKSGPTACAFPPLWGAQSFNVGAGMARVSVAAAFVQAKMPLGNADDRPWQVSRLSGRSAENGSAQFE